MQAEGLNKTAKLDDLEPHSKSHVFGAKYIRFFSTTGTIKLCVM